MKFIVRLLSFSLLVACSSPTKTTVLKKEANYDAFVETAFKLFNDKKFDAALAEFKKIDVDEYEFGYEILNYIGVVYLRKMELEQAKNYFNASLAKKPNYADPYNNLGIVYLSKGRYELALSEFQACLQHDPRHEKALKNRKLVDNLLNKKISLETIEMFSKARNQTDLAQQIESYKEILSEQPNLKEAKNNLAVCYFYQKNAEMAKQLLQEVLAAEPRYYEAHNNYAFVLAEGGDQELAKRHFLTSIKLRPTYTIALINLGELYYNQGNSKNAEQIWRSFLKVEIAKLKNI